MGSWYNILYHRVGFKRNTVHPGVYHLPHSAKLHRKERETVFTQAETSDAPNPNSQFPLQSTVEISALPAASLQRISVNSGSDPGRRSQNEDSVLTIVNNTMHGTKPVLCGLFVVADGMGGHVGGQEASLIGIQTMTQEVCTHFHNLDLSNGKQLLSHGVERANAAIHKKNQSLKSDKTENKSPLMGSTIAAALVLNGTAYIANVGDSRVYLYRPSEGLRQITLDHSIIARMVTMGTIRPEDIYTHPKRNQIYRCLGEGPSVDVDTFTVKLCNGDILLLCSDGLWEMVRDPDIEHIIESSRYQFTALSHLLIQAALNRGGTDNISVVVARVSDIN